MRTHPHRLSHAIALLLALSSGGALAQEIDHSPHAAPAPKKAEPARHAHDHATMDHAAKAAIDSKQENGHAPHGEAEPKQALDHGSMDHAAMGHGTAASAEPREPIPPLTDADRAAAFPSDLHGHQLHGSVVNSYFLFNRLEAFDADPGAGESWEASGWIGGDINRLWLRSEGERADGATESADLELLYGRAISPWWDFVAGVRQDFKPGGSQTFAAIGVQGLAPQKFEVSATAYVGERGQTAARLEAEYELLLSNRWVLQPLLEAELFGKNDPARHIGAGLSTAEAGLRLRYEFTRQFAPYIGLVHEHAFGDTADYRRRHFEKADETRLVVGLRTWF